MAFNPKPEDKPQEEAGRISVAEISGLKRREDETLGFVNGCFDPLHAGHVDLIVRAKEFCDRLVVAINSDHQVTQLKGNCAVPEAKRAETLMAIEAVNNVLTFNDHHPGRLIRELQPSIVFKGTDYATGKPKGLLEYPDIQQVGAALVYLPVLYIGGHKISSSDLVKNQPGGVVTEAEAEAEAERIARLRDQVLG